LNISVTFLSSLNNVSSSSSLMFSRSAKIVNETTHFYVIIHYSTVICAIAFVLGKTDPTLLTSSSRSLY
jgi:hypothetical protein